ncbi:hypothetical protein [Roseospira visakhapatnamensis]|uniref:Uncharacterized protein n=1 Tax=Roseospira visakhapatnamensis TaxID=390880 RepID=A0A7W6RFJ6_9PROT|nr:hypothetical protein [Roseospira visakhapatnamensis]MBB4267640.1 hypothetical protein [Roseospira visakhapatnamensis]
MPLLSPADIAGALHGVARVLRFDWTGLDYFETSASGLLKSFWGPVVLLPLFLVTVAVSLMAGAILDPAPHPVRFVAIQLIAYVIDWVAFPLVILTLGDFLGFGGRAFHFLVPFNWFQIVAGLAIMTLDLGARLGIVPTGLVLMIIAMTLIYTAVLARHGLRVPWWSVVGVTVLQLTISVFNHVFAYSLLTS